MRIIILCSTEEQFIFDASGNIELRWNERHVQDNFYENQNNDK